MDRVVIREDISKGHRVRGWSLAANVGGRWVPTPYNWGSLLSSNGTGVGNRFTAVFNKALPASATQLRLIVTAAVAEPVLAMFAACVLQLFTPALVLLPTWPLPVIDSAVTVTKRSFGMTGMPRSPANCLPTVRRELRI